MEKINSELSLREAIVALETKQIEEGKVLREQFHVAYESVQPINLIKSTLKEVYNSNEIREKLITTSIGLATGYLSKTLFEGTSHSPNRKLVGTALMFGITELVANHPEEVKAFGKGVFNLIRSLSRNSGNFTEASRIESSHPTL